MKNVLRLLATVAVAAAFALPAYAQDAAAQDAAARRTRRGRRSTRSFSTCA